MILRKLIQLEGAVQGVGFRPFVYRIALDSGITGSISNDTRGVVIEAEGDRERLDSFREVLYGQLPPLAHITRAAEIDIEPRSDNAFVILPSGEAGGKTATVLADAATCDDCLHEIFDPRNRRHLYPFTNCTNCGPRYTIIQKLPYDRRNTTMAGFVLCEACRKEYEDPGDRRFHAQPNACPECGPKLELWGADGRSVAAGHDALLGAALRIRQGEIVAVKGLGGYHLVADARRSDTVVRLREKKNREEKPFALLFPSLEMIREECRLEPGEVELLTGREAPIVILERKEGASGSGIADGAAPGNPYFGIMLPCTPLHHILIKELAFPLVATSGNLSDEPIVIDESEAIGRLSGIADSFLVHDRPIARHVDDSIVRLAAGRGMMLRRSRGYAPLPVDLDSTGPPILAVGAHLKNTVATVVDRSVFVSQHIGDLETAEAHRAFERTIRHLEGMHDLEPAAVACDLHPDYLSTRHARESGRRVVPVQHHLAHVLSCMAENRIDGPVLGVSWDGTGYGADGTVWGGEFLKVDGSAFRRLAHLRTFPLPGGEKGVREPRRSALGLLFEIDGSGKMQRANRPAFERFDKGERAILLRALQRGVNAPRTSSAGRLFDAVASLLGIRQVSAFEGQAAMELEYAARRAGDASVPDWEIPLVPGADSTVLDWEPMVRALLESAGAGEETARLAMGFHRSLICAILKSASRSGERRVVLTGGCFQNRLLLEGSIEALQREGFEVYWHRIIPPNDGGISLGQVVWARRLLKDER